jgi:hypothetical protein
MNTGDGKSDKPKVYFRIKNCSGDIIQTEKEILTILHESLENMTELINSIKDKDPLLKIHS